MEYSIYSHSISRISTDKICHRGPLSLHLLLLDENFMLYSIGWYDIPPDETDLTRAESRVFEQNAG